jgi:hypothetical protein
LGGKFGMALGDLVAVAEEIGDEERGHLGNEVLQRGVAGATPTWMTSERAGQP